jgi:hypothetical protein
LGSCGSLDEELRLEGEAVGDARSAETGSVEHPLGPAGQLTARVDTDDGPVLVQEWLIRPGPVAYRILFILAGETPESRLGEVARIARSLVVNPE